MCVNANRNKSKLFAEKFCCELLVRSCTNLGNISALTEYVEEIFQEYLSSSKDELEEAARKLKNMNPAPVNTMLQKQPREENQGVKNGCGRCSSYQPTGQMI